MTEELKNELITINLVNEVKNRLLSSGLVKQCNEGFLQHPMIQVVMFDDPIRQRNNLNVFFLYQLASFNSESMEERYCLINDGTPEEWLRLFESKILPFLISKNIPAVIH